MVELNIWIRSVMQIEFGSLRHSVPSPILYSLRTNARLNNISQIHRFKRWTHSCLPCWSPAKPKQNVCHCFPFLRMAKNVSTRFPWRCCQKSCFRKNVPSTRCNRNKLKGNNIIAYTTMSPLPSQSPQWQSQPQQPSKLPCSKIHAAWCRFSIAVLTSKDEFYTSTSNPQLGQSQLA